MRHDIKLIASLIWTNIRLLTQKKFKEKCPTTINVHKSFKTEPTNIAT